MFLDLACTLLPWLPAARRAKVSLPALLEMAADDVAARRYGSRVLSSALGRVGMVSSPAGAMAAAGGSRTGLSRRLARLESVVPGVQRGTKLLARGAALGLTAAPAATVVLAVAAIPLPC
jgi:hypothetical protein